MQKYPASTKVMEFWKEPDGSFLWIDKDGVIADYKIQPGGKGRLFQENGAICLKTPDGKAPLGKMRGPIQNRDKLLVDRKDKPGDESNKFRNWCEKPGTAYCALAAALFTPQVQTGFSAAPRPGVKCPDADPLTGYDYLAHIHVSLPHFIEGRTRLIVQAWQAGVESVPHLIYDERIAVHVDDNQPLRQMSVTWPLNQGYDRKLDVTIRVRLDLYGDGRLCLPLDPDTGLCGGPEHWLTETRRVDKHEIRYSQDPLAILMEVGM
jgi:hypothetical protein